MQNRTVIAWRLARLAAHPVHHAVPGGMPVSVIIIVVLVVIIGGLLRDSLLARWRGWRR